MKICRLFGACTVAALALGTAAQAAPGRPSRSWGSECAVAGGFVPSGSDAKDKGGFEQIRGRLQYGLPIIGSLGLLSHTVIGLGCNRVQGGAHSEVIPLTVSQLFGVGGASPTAAGNAYYGVGVGAYFLNQSNISVATRIGAQVQAGYNFTSVVFADAKYQFVDHANGFVVSVGGRFYSPRTQSDGPSLSYRAGRLAFEAWLGVSGRLVVPSRCFPRQARSDGRGCVPGSWRTDRRVPAGLVPRGTAAPCRRPKSMPGSHGRLEADR